jgi:hypothetical protein
MSRRVMRLIGLLTPHILSSFDALSRRQRSSGLRKGPEVLPSATYKELPHDHQKSYHFPSLVLMKTFIFLMKILEIRWNMGVCKIWMSIY